MNRIFASLTLICAACLVAPLAASGVTIDWIPVGNPGNAADPATGSLYGAVGYAYKIDKYDVTNNQYVEFLNAKDSTGANTLGLYNSVMTTSSFGGINFTSGNANGAKYSVISGDGNHPVNAVSWYSSIRFVNWIDNNQGGGDTETGAYTLLGGTPTPSNASSITRNAGPAVVLPSESEWYKAAYYNSATSSYFQYGTSSNTAPIATSPTSIHNAANYHDAVSNLTDVGAYTGTTSPYGTFDMAGNVFQWNEALTAGLRGSRGGAFYIGSNSFDLLSSTRFGNDPANGSVLTGFRVAVVPEPSTAVLAVIACGLAWLFRKRFK